MGSFGCIRFFPVIAALTLALGPWAASAHAEPDREKAEAFEALLDADFARAARTYLALFEADTEGPLAGYYFQRLLHCAERAGDKGKTCMASAKPKAIRIPLLLAILQWRDTTAFMRKGELTKAAGLAEDMGFARSFAFIGPFENEGESGFAETYDVEKDLEGRKSFPDFSKTFDGKAGKVSWNVPPVKPPSGRWALNSFFREEKDVCAYALTFIHAKKARDAAFRLGTDGAVKIWLNGALLFEGDTYRRPGLDQDTVAAHLGVGWNEIIIKTCHKKGPWTLLFRVTAPDGSPLPDLTIKAAPWRTDKDAVLAPRGPEKAKTTPNAGAAAELDARIRGGDDSPLSAVRWAFLALARGMRDENDRLARNRLSDAVSRDDHPYVRLLYAEAIPDRNKALAQVRKATETAPDRVLPWFHLAKMYGPPRTMVRFIWGFALGGDDAAGTQEEYARIKEVEIWEKEEEYLTKVLSLRPDFRPARIGMALLFCRRAGWQPRDDDTVPLTNPWAIEARTRLTALLIDAPARGMLGKILDNFVPRTAAKEVALYRGYLAADFTDIKARQGLAQTLLTLGKRKEALAVWARALELTPWDRTALGSMADILIAQDDFEGASHFHEQSLRICPDDVEAIQKLAECRLVLGRRDEAMALFRRALEIKPQLPAVSRRLRHLRPAEREFWVGHRLDLAPFVAKARAAKDLSKKDAVCFLKNDVIFVAENGTSRLFTQRVLLILTRKAVREYKHISAYPSGLDYWAATRGEVLTAKIVHPDGTEEEGDWWEGSSSARFNQLKEGDIIVFEAKLEETGDARYRDYFGLMFLLQDEYIPFRDSRITFVHAKTKKLHFHAVKCTAEPFTEERDGMLVHRWRMEAIPEVKEEAFMPNIFELCPYVHASTFGKWEDVSDWFLSLCRDQFESCDPLEKAVLKVVKGLATSKEKVDALFQFLVSDIRYESLSLADHSFRPFKACKTFTRKYGDCKDTAALFVAMLDIVGIPAHMVLVRAGNGDRLDLALPSMHVFNHAIAFVPGLGTRGVFFDCTARYCGSRELPAMDQGAIALVAIPQTGAHALFIPYDKPKANLNRLACTVTLAPDGSARMEAKAFVRGQDASTYRMSYQKGSKRKKLIEREYNRFLKAAKAESVHFSDLSDYNKPVEYEAVFRVPALARVEGTGMAVQASLFPLQLISRWLQTDMRHHVLIVGHPRRWEREVVLVLPPGFVFRSIPKNNCSESDLACFAMTFERLSPAKLRINVEFELRAPRIEPGEYPAMRSFAASVDQAEAEEIIIGRDK